jgi:hypothetical protein
MNATISSLWIGDSLSSMEQMCIRSFLRHGHTFRLYTYAPVQNIPPETEISDANQVLPESAIFRYANGSFAGFANYFRYKMLLDNGGWWVDLDTICLKPFDFAGEHVFATEMHHGTPVVTNAMIKAPLGSAFCDYAWRICQTKDPARLVWGETGPRLAGEAVALLGYSAFVVPPATFCPVDPDTWEEIFDPNGRTDFGPGNYAVHLWNELWRREGLDKNASYPPGCLYERLKSIYLDS